MALTDDVAQRMERVEAARKAAEEAARRAQELRDAQDR